jgi:hypothetical protein
MFFAKRKRSRRGDLEEPTRSLLHSGSPLTHLQALFYRTGLHPPFTVDLLTADSAKPQQDVQAVEINSQATSGVNGAQIIDTCRHHAPPTPKCSVAVNWPRALSAVLMAQRPDSVTTVLDLYVEQLVIC